MKIVSVEDTERSLDRASFKNSFRNKKTPLKNKNAPSTKIKIDKPFEYTFGNYISNLLHLNCNNNMNKSIINFKK